MSTTADPAHDRAMTALAIADHVRQSNARYLADLKQQPMQEGLLRAARLLRDGDMKGPAGSIRAYRLLSSIRWFRSVRVDALLHATATPATRPLRQMSPRARDVLAAKLEHAAANSRGLR